MAVTNKSEPVGTAYVSQPVVAPEEPLEEPLEESDRDFGFAAATLIGGGAGVAAFGIITFLFELNAKSTAWTKAFALSTSVGPLSGKVAYALLAWVVAWGVLALALRNRRVSAVSTYVIAFALMAVGFILTYPPVWALFGA